MAPNIIYGINPTHGIEREVGRCLGNNSIPEHTQ